MKTSPAQFVRQVKQEWSKITWPSVQETVQGTLVVIFMSVILAGALFVIDSVCAAFVRVFIGG